MLRGFRIAVVVTAVVAAVSIGVFLYLTRGIAAPSAAVTASAEPIDLADTNTSQVVFRIAQEESTVTYSVFEVLNAVDKMVVGSTDQIAGDILIDLNDPRKSEVGVIAVNARTFASDDERRDNSVARFVLQSEVEGGEFITFAATKISGLPTSLSGGETASFSMTGALTVGGETREVTFAVSASLESAAALVGHAEAIIQRSAFSLSIPNVPFVADVGDDVTLQLDFVAHAVSDTVA